MEQPYIATTKIVAAIVDTTNLTLYRPDGSTIVIPQGDPRVKRVIESATPQIIQNGYAFVDLAAESVYSKFEQESKGSVSFFKIAKAKLRNIFRIAKEEPVESAVIGRVPPVPNAAEVKVLGAIQQILEHAVPVSAQAFDETGVAQQRAIVEADGKTPNDANDQDAETHTIVAVTRDQAVVPGVEKIKSQFSHAMVTGALKNMETFLARAGKVANERQHSVQDLLKFMERGDLPIAEDGSILIYKALDRRTECYVDVHTKKVTQRVGDYVCMDPSLVDHNRNNECSNGLHVARRGYVGGFGGDVCVLAKLSPEDVIAVPTYDANKMRVCGYHIIAELTPKMFSLLKANRPISDDDEGAKLLADALAGRHVGKLREVRITAQMGGGVEIKDLQAPTIKITAPMVRERARALENQDRMVKDTPVDPKAVAQATKAIKPTAPAPKNVVSITDGEGSFRERIHALLAIGIEAQGVAAAIYRLKQQSRKSWSTLGVTDEQVAEIMRLANPSA